MDGIKVNSPEELEFASKGLKKHGIKNESVESPKARLDLTKKKMFSTSENEAKGINPTLDMPRATETIFCSAIYISKNLSGNSFLNFSAKVEFEVSASKTTT